MPDAIEQQLPAGKRQRSSAAPASATGVQAPVRLHPWYLTDDFILPYRAAFTNSELPSSFTIAEPTGGSGQGSIIAHPFHTGKLLNVFPPTFLHGLKSELGSLNWHERSNDLYSFHQTDDLALNGHHHIKALRDYMAGEEFVTFMENITGTRLTRGYLDLAAQRYKKGNHLLCHDDDVHRGKLARRIAYIIYLVDDQWSVDDGGALGLFGNDHNKHPTEVLSRITPEFNSLGFFLTGLISYHTVEEVTVNDPSRERWSVTGWFYGPVDEPDCSTSANVDSILPAPLSPSLLPALEPFTATDLASSDSGDCAEWSKWVNPDYLKPSLRDQICDSFLDQSSIELRHFLRTEMYDQIISETKSSDFWSTASLKGPTHLRKYLEATPSSDSTPKLFDLARFLCSASFARLLTALTSIDFVNASQQLRKFEHGHYTLIHDQVPEPFGLDVTLSLQPHAEGSDQSSWIESWGGATHYIADKDELLRINPEPNSLSLVLRDEGTLRFVKFLNHTASQSRQEISMVFTMPPSSESDDDDDDNDST
ncbi:putative component of NuA3 histone acetyltransferase complex [Coemansia sp. RSA 2320]|nr:putative component of NuA3 histone acetyltransferase complex [Coemansia sp. RSA 2320]